MSEPQATNEALREWVSKPLNPWHPETNPLTLAVLGKFAEELAECSAIVARCVIQGWEESEPVTGVVNLAALENEIADVVATANDVSDFLHLNVGQMDERVTHKRAHLARWHALLRSESPTVTPDTGSKK